jgi:hypothetical protein
MNDFSELFDAFLYMSLLGVKLALFAFDDDDLRVVGLRAMGRIASC